MGDGDGAPQHALVALRKSVAALFRRDVVRDRGTGDARDSFMRDDVDRFHRVARPLREGDGDHIGLLAAGD